jgi:hypothetical protein
MDLEGLTESRMEGQGIFLLKALVRKTASRCLLTWSERKFNLIVICEISGSQGGEFGN